MITDPLISVTHWSNSTRQCQKTEMANQIKKGRCPLQEGTIDFLRRQGSFNICQKVLQMFYQTVILFYAVVFWGSSIKKRDATRLDKLVKKSGSVVGVEIDSVTSVAESRTLNNLLSILDNVHHLLHSTISRQKSTFSERMLSLSCSTDRLRDICPSGDTTL